MRGPVRPHPERHRQEVVPADEGRRRWPASSAWPRRPSASSAPPCAALIREGKAQLGKNDTVRPAPSLPEGRRHVQAPHRRRRRRPRRRPRTGLPPQEYYVPDHLTHDAATGDEVMIAVRQQVDRTSTTDWPRSREVVRAGHAAVRRHLLRARRRRLRPRGRHRLHAQRRVGDPRSRGRSRTTRSSSR